MQGMLKKIIDVDKKATATVEKAKKEKENIEKKLSEAKKVIEEDYAKKTADNIQAIRENLSKNFDSAEKLLALEYEEKTEKLKEKFEKHSDIWANEIAERAIQD